MIMKIKNVSIVLLGLLTLSATAYAFDFDKKFDVNVLKPITNSKYKVEEQKKEEIKEEKKVPVTPVISTNGFSYVSTATKDKHTPSIDKYYDDDAGVVCYVSGSSLQCLKVY